MTVSRRVLSRHVAKELMAGASASAVTDQLAAYVVTHKLHGSLNEIIDDIRRELSKSGHVSAVVTTARPLDDELRAKVEKRIAANEQVQTVEMIETVDPGMIGGIIIETPTKRFDASIATKLKRLKQTV